MNQEWFRKQVHDYIVSMTFFKELYEEGTLPANIYELIEVKLAVKYGLDTKSVIRTMFTLKRYQVKLNKNQNLHTWSYNSP